MADLQFAAWAQTRLGNAVERVDDGGDLEPARFRPGVSVTGPTAFTVHGPALQLLGPGAVVGLDRSVVLRHDPPPGASDDTDREQSELAIADASARALAAAGRQNGCLLVLEDPQWADPETLAVVEYLADHLRYEPAVGQLPAWLQRSIGPSPS